MGSPSAPDALTDSTVTAVVEAPIAAIDVGAWLFSLTDQEYQLCAPGDHVAAGTTFTDDGRRMSINVEYVGGTLIVQHYIAETVSPTHCRLVSQSDSFGPFGRTKLGVIWELTVRERDANTSVLSNRVVILPTDEYVALLADHGISIDAATEAQRAAVTAHNNLETPLYARSLAKTASSSTESSPEAATS
jgi:hypothetical protein